MHKETYSSNAILIYMVTLKKYLEKFTANVLNFFYNFAPCINGGGFSTNLLCNGFQ